MKLLCWIGIHGQWVAPPDCAAAPKEQDRCQEVPVSLQCVRCGMTRAATRWVGHSWQEIGAADQNQVRLPTWFSSATLRKCTACGKEGWLLKAR